MKWSLIFSLALLLTGCGNATDTAADNSAAAGDGNSDSLAPCELLTRQQVATVLPDADAGFATARGRSLLPGVRNFQCSWSNPEDASFYLVFEIAADDQAFDTIKPKERAAYVRDLGAREPGLGEESWIYEDRGGSLRFKIVQNRKVIDLHLESADAPSRESALIELGRIVAERLN